MTEIDDSLYSRQRYVLGDGAMKRMANSRVFLAGLSGLGIEAAKSLTLSGVKSIELHDPIRASVADLSTQFFISTDDIAAGRTRAEASAPKLAELNPYVTINVSSVELSQTADLSFLTAFQCVILVDLPFDVCARVDAFCRAQSPSIAFLAAETRGVFGFVFDDFGDAFEVVDALGEDLKEVYIADITQEEQGIVTVIENHFHGLEDGDRVQFREVQGMEPLNQGIHVVKVLTPSSFSIGNTSSFPSYTGGGIMSQLQRKQRLCFQSFSEQLVKPSYLEVDFAKLGLPHSILIAFRAYHSFQATHGRMPGVWNDDDAAIMLQIAEKLNEGNLTPVDKDVIVKFSFTCNGNIAPMTATLGSWLAQEALKGLTGKFTPINQFLLFDMTELIPDISSSKSLFQPRGDRYDAQRACIGEELCELLRNQRLFMIGCGAIGCEMLKNYALLGVGSGPQGLVTITDNDLIEKSNLNRQFLFRPHHIQQPKSVTAASAVKIINNDIKIDSHQHKVGPETISVFSDEFFLNQTVVVNALDNVAARLFVDDRCVTNKRALLESGTLGAKGHVQVIVPDLTESYSSQRDPEEGDVPYCTLKSFPNQIEHTIQWAREKFGNLFEFKPSEFNKFWAENGSFEKVAECLQQGQQSSSLSRASQVLKLLRNRPFTLHDCIALARIKFEKYFNHKARQLVCAYPLDTRLKNGALFWASPKRPPVPIIFNVNDPLHFSFLVNAARLFAAVYAIPCSPEQLKIESVIIELQTVEVPPFIPKSALNTVTDESVKKQDVKKQEDPTDLTELANTLLRHTSSAISQGHAPIPSLIPVVFEKDDDSNAHIDFITAASNLRATSYGLTIADRLKTKRIAGRIVPAIATTTGVVSGLVSAELIKIVKKSPLTSYKNAFLSLAVPILVFGEPAEASKTKIGENTFITIWDKWEYRGNEETTLETFLAWCQTKMPLKLNGIFHGAAAIYMPLMPMHAKRLPKPLKKFLKLQGDEQYVELVVSFDGTDAVMPPVRYYL